MRSAILWDFTQHTMVIPPPELWYGITILYCTKSQKRADPVIHPSFIVPSVH